MDTPKITAYLKTTCGWSNGVRAVLAKYNLPYTEKDIIQNPAFRWEMETKTGQPQYLVENNLVQANPAEAAVPTNAPCAHEQHDSAVQMRL
jgi:glutaredoxin-related protein